jgi:hypothetical protein
VEKKENGIKCQHTKGKKDYGKTVIRRRSSFFYPIKILKEQATIELFVLLLYI